MALPLSPPVKPQLAKSGKALPTGDGWAYEPKYDGFRAIVFVDGADVYIQSRGSKPLARYFPDLSFPKGRYVIDGEIVIDSTDGHEDFGALQQRLHPAESRVKMLAEQTPARFIAFDLLVEGDEELLELPLSERRKRLERLVKKLVKKQPVSLAPVTRDPDETEPWQLEAEGVIAKELEAPYRPGSRKGMVKFKRVRTIDVVIVGWRPGKEKGTVGSLIFGLYDGDDLRVVGHTSGFTAKEKRELVAKLKPYETGERGHGDPSRWATERDLEWIALRPELVVEINFDHTSGGRIRHGTKILRWRDDKAPEECLFEQLAS
jgi:ATP-dependent DNA ligase